MQLTKSLRFVGLAASLLLSIVADAQPCPGFQSGNPANNLQTVNFYDLSGNLIASCQCQLTGNAFKCGSCLPAAFAAYEYMVGGVPVDCINAVFLPVELKRFEALVTAGNVKLSWVTETERDNAKFILERSSDGLLFDSFLEVGAAGTSLSEQNYTAEDNDPIAGLSYYRLSQADVNGTVTQLAVVAVETKSTLTGIVLAPNPANGACLLQLPLHTGTVEFRVMVSDRSGKIVRQLTTSEDIGLDLPAGFYQVVVSSGAGQWTEKLIVWQD